MSATTPYWTRSFEDFVAYFSRYYPALRQSIVGASEEQVQDLQQRVGIPFPPEYGAFLLTMGNTPPRSLGTFLEYSTYGIQVVKDFYGTPGLRFPPDAVYLWTYEFDTPFDIFIRTGGEECDIRPLVQGAWAVDPDSEEVLDQEPSLIWLGQSLPQYLYKEGFRGFRDPLLPHYAELREPATAEGSPERHVRLVAGFRTIAARLGFQPVPFMNQDLVYYDRPDATLKLYGQVAADVIYARAADERELARLCEILGDALDMVRWG